MLSAAVVLVFGLCVVPSIQGHGLMTDPPARNTIWREGFPNPANYDDMGLNCGGFKNQWEVNGGRCGVCGDPAQGPLKHQAGYDGGYANGIIGRHYRQGDTIKVTAKITANHLGFVYYKICPVNNKDTQVTQSCLDKYLLTDASGKSKFYVADYISNRPGSITIGLKLPAGLTCSQCVIQWTYTAGNNHGGDSVPQETFVNCADVTISVNGGPDPRPTKETGALKRKVGGVTKQDENGTPQGNWDCDVVEPFNMGEKHQSIYDWCLTHCISVPPKDRECPDTHCSCYEVKVSAYPTSTLALPPKTAGPVTTTARPVKITDKPTMKKATTTVWTTKEIVNTPRPQKENKPDGGGWRDYYKPRDLGDRYNRWNTGDFGSFSVHNNNERRDRNDRNQDDYWSRRASDLHRPTYRFF